MNLSLIIVTWNAKRIVRECLESLRKHTKDPNTEIIVVDNASSDGTSQLIREHFPQVKLRQNDANLGFARANNIGIRLSTGKYVCLVNSDVVVPAGCLEKMVQYMDQHQDIGMLGPKMLLPEGTIGQSCLRFPSVWNWFCRALALDRLFKGARLFGGFLMTDFCYDRVMDVDVLTGWFWMVRREALNRVGLLDERFFMYGEDIDWSKRFHEAGWRVVFYPEAEAVHYCAASSAIAPTRFYVEMNRANMQYCQRNHSTFAVFGFWLTTWLHEVIRIVGYGIVYLLKGAGNPEAMFKVKRSTACLLWLMGLKWKVPAEPTTTATRLCPKTSPNTMLRKLYSLSRRLREEGILATGSFVAARFIALLRYGSPLPPNTVEANLEQWSRHDWSAHGEEWTPSHEWKMSLVKHVLEPNIPVGSNVLEIGPGAGRWTDFLVQRAAHLIAVDLTPRCIEVCRQRFNGQHNISFFVNDGTDLSFIPAASVDRIWSFDVFVHIHPQDIENYMRQLSQILAAGGRGVIHHAARGIQKKGWRSDMTAQTMIEFCTKYGLVIVRQFTSWEDDHFHINPHLPDNSADVITIFEKPYASAL